MGKYIGLCSNNLTALQSFAAGGLGVNDQLIGRSAAKLSCHVSAQFQELVRMNIDLHKKLHTMHKKKPNIHMF